VVLDLDQRTPEREALRQAVGRPGEIAEDVPSAKLMYLWRVSWQGRYKKGMNGMCAHEVIKSATHTCQGDEACDGEMIYDENEDVGGQGKEEDHDPKPRLDGPTCPI
jgi:hypothetical protein